MHPELLKSSPFLQVEVISILDLAYIFLYLWNSQTHFGCQAYLYYLFDANRLVSRIKLGKVCSEKK